MLNDGFFDSCSGVSNVELLNCFDAAETFDLAVDLVELLGSGEHAVPGLCVVRIGHVVVGVVACNYHQRTENDFLVSGCFHGLDDFFAGGLFGLAFDGSDEYVLVSERVHHGLHLGVGDLSGVGSSVSHEYERGAVLFSVC